MADKSVGELIAAQSVTPTDLFVLEQNGTAKKLTGQILENWLVSFADGHGGIQSIEKLSTNVLADTYRITLADTTTFDFVVTNGRGITGISKTSTSGLVDTYTISYNNGTTSKFTVTNGAKGDKGDNAYIWIKYASQEPTGSSHSMGDIPDDWIGIYSGNASTAPTDWQQYKWFKHKGEKGDTGSPATLMTKSVTYQVSDSGTIIPSGSWGSSIPVVPQGKYLWTKSELRFNTGDPIVSYSVARMGIDGSGSVSSVAGVSPDATGNVTLTAADVGALAVSGGDMEGAINMNGQPISGLNDPVEDTQAARKGYVDAAKAAANAYTDASVRKAAPRNLLDNSDFRNPVDQRGGKLIPPGVPYYVYAQGQAGTTSTYCTVTKTIDNLAFIIIDGNEYVADTSTMVDGYSGPGYTIDRWIMLLDIGVINVVHGGLNLDAANHAITFAQYLDDGTLASMVASGKKYTVAINYTVNTVGGDANLFERPKSGEVHRAFAFETGLGNHTSFASFTPDSTGENFQYAPVWIYFGQGWNVTLHWIALYEGEYTAETLQEYQPKGYGAELLECQRYYQIRSSNNISAVDMRPTMRLSSPTITSVTGGYAYSADL